MGKQYKELTNEDMNFIKEQKLFYIASSSGKEVNLSPKGYDTIRVLDNKRLLFLSYSGSGNRTFTDAKKNGEFTVLFNAFTGSANILRLFCKAKIVENKSQDFNSYLNLFNEKESLVRNFFIFEIYAVESSCGESVPYMEYKEDRDSLKSWMVKMDINGKLEKFNRDYFTPPDIKNI